MIMISLCEKYLAWC